MIGGEEYICAAYVKVQGKKEGGGGVSGVGLEQANLKELLFIEKHSSEV